MCRVWDSPCGLGSSSDPLDLQDESPADLKSTDYCDGLPLILSFSFFLSSTRIYAAKTCHICTKRFVCLRSTRRDKKIFGINSVLRFVLILRESALEKNVRHGCARLFACLRRIWQAKSCKFASLSRLPITRLTYDHIDRVLELARVARDKLP